ncbi:MAG: hypothetical protein AAFO94_11510, partial [Bacteroidota bacterium]
MKYKLILLSLLITVLAGCEKETYEIPSGLVYGLSFDDEQLHPDMISWASPIENLSAQRSSNESFDGTQSLVLTSTTNDNNTFAYWGISIQNFEPGKKLRFIIRAKANELTGQGFGFNVFARAFDTRETLSFGTSGTQTTTNNEWKTYTIEMDRFLTNDVEQVDFYMLLFE